MTNLDAKSISEWKSTPLGAWDYIGCGIAWIFIPILLVCGPLLLIAFCALAIIILAIPSWLLYSINYLFQSNKPHYFASLDPTEVSQLELTYLKIIEEKGRGGISVDRRSVELDVRLSESGCRVVEHCGDEKAASITLNVIKASLLKCNPEKGNRNQPCRETILFIHGMGSSSTLNLSSSIPLLVNTYDIIGLDLPGFGRSSMDTSLHHSSSSQIADIFSACIHYVVENMVSNGKVIIIGHSFGAHFLLEFVERYESSISKIILLDPAGLLPTLESYGMYFALLFYFGIPTKPFRYLGNLGITLVNLILMILPGDNIHLAYKISLLGLKTNLADVLMHKFIDGNNWNYGGWCAPKLFTAVKTAAPIALVYGEYDNLTPFHQGILLSRLRLFPTVLYQVKGAWHEYFHLKNGSVFSFLIQTVVKELSKTDRNGYKCSWSQREENFREKYHENLSACNQNIVWSAFMSTYSVTNSFNRIRDEYRCLEIMCARSVQDARNDKYITSSVKGHRKNSPAVDEYLNCTDGECHDNNNKSSSWYFLIENSSVVSQKTISSLNSPYF